MPVLSDPEHENIKPKYLYSLTVSIFEFLYLKFLLISLPVLLNIIALVLSMFIVKEFSCVYRVGQQNWPVFEMLECNHQDRW